MSEHESWNPQRFYRDPAHGKIMGVCAGFADYFGWNVTVVRILAIAALIWLNMLVLVAYVVLGVLLPKKPAHLYTWDTDEAYWSSVRRSPAHTFGDVRYRLRTLDSKLGRMESYVTSGRYDLERQFRDLEKGDGTP